MSNNFNNDMLESISLCKGLGTGGSTEVGLEAINMELLNDTSVEVTASNIILVMFEHFIGTFEGRSELCGQEVFLGATNVIEDKVTRLIDILGGRIGGGDSLETVGIAALLSYIGFYT